jgi:hypothetical protein
MDVEKYLAEAETVTYEGNPGESARAEIKEALDRPDARIEDEIEIFTNALETNFANPVSEEKLALKERMEQFIRQDKATLEWLGGEEETPEMLLMVADRVEREADGFLFFAKSESGSERVADYPAGELTGEEKTSMGYAGRLYYSASVLRKGITKTSKVQV